MEHLLETSLHRFVRHFHEGYCDIIPGAAIWIIENSQFARSMRDGPFFRVKRHPSAVEIRRFST